MKTGKYYQGYFTDYATGMFHAGMLVTGALLGAVLAATLFF